MPRRWKSVGWGALLVPLMTAGCGIGRSDVLPARREPVGLAPLPPIHESINGSDPAREARDERVALARSRAEATGSPAEEPSAKSRIRRAPWARDSEALAANGRPSPTAPAAPEPNSGEPPAFPARMPAEPATIPDAVPPPEMPAEPAPSPAPRPSPAGDPSLGTTPDAVPDIEMPPSRPATSPAPVPIDEPAPLPNPAPVPAPSRPAADPSMGPNPDAVPDIEMPPARTGPATSTEPAQVPDLPPDAAMPAPAEVPALPADEAPPIEVPALPPAEAAPVEVPALPPAGMPPIAPVEVPTIPPDYVPPTAPAADPAVRPASAAATAKPNDTMPPGAEWKVAPGKAASETAARVGDEIITLSELRTAVREQIRGMNLPRDQQPSPADTNAVASLMLDRMIDRVILVQEAKRKIKDEKKWKQFMDAIEHGWREKELPDLIRQNGVPDEYALKKKLDSEKLSLQDKHAAFVQNTMAREYLMGQVKDRIRVYAPAMKEYYEAHRNDFDRPAEVRWREVTVEVSKHADRAEARRKAEAVLARLRRGESFAKVAQAESEGPTADKGGFWETSPDGYNVPAVRDALAGLPPNQVSGLLEGPNSFHIVLVESRRAAGPARFDEVQDEVRKILIEKKEADEMNAYLDGIRSRYVVTSIFDGSDSAPGAGRKAMENATGRRGR